MHGDVLILEPGEASGQPYYGANRDESDANAVGHGSILNLVALAWGTDKVGQAYTRRG